MENGLSPAFSPSPSGKRHLLKNSGAKGQFLGQGNHDNIPLTATPAALDQQIVGLSSAFVHLLFQAKEGLVLVFERWPGCQASWGTWDLLLTCWGFFHKPLSLLGQLSQQPKKRIPRRGVHNWAAGAFGIPQIRAFCQAKYFAWMKLVLLIFLPKTC